MFTVIQRSYGVYRLRDCAMSRALYYPIAIQLTWILILMAAHRSPIVMKFETVIVFHEMLESVANEAHIPNVRPSVRISVSTLTDTIAFALYLFLGI